MIPTPGGDHSRSTFNGQLLSEILPTPAEAEEFHHTYAKIVTKKVLERKDPMATFYALQVLKLDPLLEKVGADSAAKFCYLLAKTRAISVGRGVDGKQQTALENLAR